MLIEVLDREMNSIDAHLTVVFHHLILLYSAEAHVSVCLHVEHASNASLLQQVNVFFFLGIRSQPYLGFTNLVKFHITYKIGVSLLDMPVDNEDGKHIPP